MDRRAFLRRSSGAAIGAVLGSASRADDQGIQELWGNYPPAYSVIPVVSDGRWVWKNPPEDQTGYLEPREYDLKIGIQIEGAGNATQVRATTVVPVDLPEQKLLSANVQTTGCEAGLRQLAEQSGQLLLAAPSIAAGQVISAVATFRVRLFKDYQGYTKDQFPTHQPALPDLKPFLIDSPGIQTRVTEVRKVAGEITQSHSHPWDQAHAFYRWVWDNIQARLGKYTSVEVAMRDHVGDCEERAAVFVALCRAAGIPARLVWVPNHNWAEFALRDSQGKPHWIPAHTSCYSWFGWTGAHELVLQKGDRIMVPEKRTPQRLVADWAQWQGARPKVQWGAELTPLPTESESDAGPGHRRKDEKGEWVVIGTHELDGSLRDGERSLARNGSLPK